MHVQEQFLVKSNQKVVWQHFWIHNWYHLGICSIMTLVVIGYDRYNVIVKGINGFRMSYAVAIPLLALVWIYSIAAAIPPFFGWGGYALGTTISNTLCIFAWCFKVFLFSEGLLVTCSYDFMSSEWNRQSFILFAFMFNYVTPMILMSFFYSQIVKSVIAHEKQLKELATKMNVSSIRSKVSKSFCNQRTFFILVIYWFSIGRNRIISRI